MLVRLLPFILITACSSYKKTPYQKQQENEGGYVDTSFEELRVAGFKANTRTEKELAQSYAEFRALENCRGEGKKANIIAVVDKTVAKEVTRSSGTSWGPGHFGMYPYYSRFSTFGFGAGFNTIDTNTWSETLLFPIYEVYYTCADKIYRPQVMFKEISAEQMKHLVKDLKGGLQIENMEEQSPNKGNLQVGDIILKANGKRIEKVYDLIRMFDENNQQVPVQLLREGERIKTTLKASDITPAVEATEQEIISKVCKEKDEKKQKQLKKSPLCN